MSAQHAHGQVLLPIPLRLQWEEENGYCGETALQCSGLYYGQYVSVGKIRAAHGSGSNKGSNQLLIGNEGKDLKLVNALKMTCVEWKTESEKEPQYQKHISWVKQQLRAHYPTILCVYVHECEDDDYDHIMLAVGVDSSDAIIYHDFFERKALKSPFPVYKGSGKVPHEDGVVATRDHASDQDHSYYVLPHDRCYSLALTGIIDPDRVCKRIRMTVDNDHEPNYLYKNEKPIPLHATLEICDLTPGHTYALVSYSDMKSVPIRDFLKQPCERRMVFKANGMTEIIKDPVTFLSSESRLYRCIEVPADTPSIDNSSSVSSITQGLDHMAIAATTAASAVINKVKDKIKPHKKQEKKREKEEEDEDNQDDGEDDEDDEDEEDEDEDDNEDEDEDEDDEDDDDNRGKKSKSRK